MVIHMKRTIMNDLIKWKNNKQKKPLIIKGARQVGKTYVIREFASNQYKYFVEINFEKDKEYVQLFERTSNPKDLLEYFQIAFMDIPFKEDTLLFLDEIQACSPAFTALKFMKDEFPCDIICSGSMLGVAIAKTSSYPVGYVETWDMYPFTFTEFLNAYGISETILGKINHALENTTDLSQSLHKKLNDYFLEYMIVGGMPEVVKCYIDTKSLKETITIQRRIVNDYLNDMVKYADAADKIKARECFASIPIQLAKENKKFQYSVVKKGYNARYYDSSLKWLEDSGLIIKVNRLSKIDSPLIAHSELSIFKVYMADTGLLISQLEDGEIKKVISGDLGIYKGALFENITAQILKYNNKKSYYYEPNQNSEIDFVISYEGNITPLEIKASTHTASRSFNNFVNKYKPIHAFRFSSKNIGISQDQSIHYLPLYLLETVLSNEKDVFDI